MTHYPIFAHLRHRPVLVVGGGHVAERKIEALLKAGAQVRVVARTLTPALEAYRRQGTLKLLAQTFCPTQIDGVFLVICASNDAALNRQVFQAAEEAATLCNGVDDLEHSSFIVPAVIDRSPLQIAVSSGGTAPVLARLWRQKIEALLPQYLGEAATLAGRWRSRVKAKIATLPARRRFWEQLFQSDFTHHLARGDSAAAEAALAAQLHEAATAANVGEVVLVGAGPGDAGLLTLNALQALQAADVVLYDALISQQILELVRRDAEKISVGKRAGAHKVAQEETNRLLIEYARQGRRVVRLKGGDPFVFGRGGEECQALGQAGIPFRIVPGITAALGATAYAGIPLTHRDYAQTALFITGHCRPDGDELHWQTLARGRQTLVVYMGTLKAADISRELIRHGRSPATPVAVISQGTLPGQTVHTGTLKDLPTLAAAAPTPALIVIGEVAALHSQLAWRPNNPTAAAITAAA